MGLNLSSIGSSKRRSSGRDKPFFVAHQFHVRGVSGLTPQPLTCRSYIGESDFRDLKKFLRISVGNIFVNLTRGTIDQFPYLFYLFILFKSHILYKSYSILFTCFEVYSPIRVIWRDYVFWVFINFVKAGWFFCHVIFLISWYMWYLEIISY